MADTLYDGVIFNEHPILKPSEILSDDDNDYGITAENFLLGSECPINEKFIEVRTHEFSQKYYSLELLNKLAELSTSQVELFLDYQLEQIDNKKQWLLRLEKLVEKGNKRAIYLNRYSGNLDHVFEPLRENIKTCKNQAKKVKRRTLSGNLPIKSFTYKQLAREPQKLLNFFHELKKHEFISLKTKATYFIKVFSNKEVTCPVVWTRLPSDFYYFIYLIYTKHELVKDVKQEQWEIACKCFIRDDEKPPFERTKLPRLKRPAMTGDILDEIVKSLL